NPDGTTNLSWDIHGANGANIGPAAAITLSYTASVDQTYTSGSMGPVLAADFLNNPIDILYDLVAGATNCSDGSGATVEVEPIDISKIIVPPVQAEYAPGDVVTFRISMEIPSGDTSQIVFRDFFPLPV